MAIDWNADDAKFNAHYISFPIFWGQELHSLVKE